MRFSIVAWGIAVFELFELAGSGPNTQPRDTLRKAGLLWFVDVITRGLVFRITAAAYA